jgi:hypothetical protein
MVYTINWFKKCQHINYCSHAGQLTFNCHKGGGRAYHLTVVYFVIFRCCFFPWYKGSLRENSFNRNFYMYALVVEGDIAGSPVGIPGNINRTNLSSEETEKQVPVLSRCPCWPIPESPLSDFLFTNFSHPEYDWNIACWTLSNQSINQSIRTLYCIQLYCLMCRHCFLT